MLRFDIGVHSISYLFYLNSVNRQMIRLFNQLGAVKSFAGKNLVVNEPGLVYIITVV
jgi:hypothetical protein